MPPRNPVQFLEPTDPLCPVPARTRHHEATGWPNPSKMSRSAPAPRVNSRMSDSEVWGLNPQRGL